MILASHKYEIDKIPDNLLGIIIANNISLGQIQNELFVNSTSREIKKDTITTNSEIDLELANAIFYLNSTYIYFLTQ